MCLYCFYYKFIFKNIYLFIWLHWVFVAACRVFIAACRIQFPDQGSNPGPLHWERGVLTTGPPGKSPFYYKFKKYYQVMGNALLSLSSSFLISELKLYFFPSHADTSPTFIMFLQPFDYVITLITACQNSFHLFIQSISAETQERVLVTSVFPALCVYGYREDNHECFFRNIH